MKVYRITICLLVLLVGCSNSGQSNDSSKYPIIESSGNEIVPTKESIKMPEASGILVVSDSMIEIDYSNTNLGYIMVKTLTEEHNRLKIQIINGDTTYNYDISKDNQYISYPLNLGEGMYNIQIRENVKDNTYALVLSQTIDVKLDDPNYPYLYPNQIIDYDLKTAAINKSFEVCEDAKTDLDRVYQVYNWVVNNISYDWDKVEEVQNKFVVPIIDETLEIKTGICFDYAALMTCMLRVQQIPTKLITGYVEEGYHAWVEVYIHDVGWVDPETYFKSDKWQRMDPTFSSANQKYDGSYETKYNY
ncbi:transglutaminase-like domain-containing protein [Anaerorhabdus sp.]|jgi:hypothetical protein|uniref:transglutaminase-like domain-containing protein n=1 Tax=Anaerorhabdus sp. TaxID=1872524 RepID=UPI002FCC2A6F